MRGDFKYKAIDPFWDKVEHGEHWLVPGDDTDYKEKSWNLCYGDIPKGFYVIRSCEQSLCISPYHLYLGREYDLPGYEAKPINVPEEPHRLTPEEIQYIKELHTLGVKLVDLGHMFYKSKSQIHRIIHDK